MRATTPTGSAAGSLSRADRLAESQRKIRPPFRLDETMRFYSPQENVDALEHPRVKAWLDFVTKEWTPVPIAGCRRRLGLLVPCCKYKPYPTSREHRGINAGLLEAGWRSVGTVPVPEPLTAFLDPDERADLLDVSPLVRDGVVLDRFVISEPLGLVPYEHVYHWRGEQSPSSSYDDPGLFEARGTSVSPDRADSTAWRTSGGRWKWGVSETDAYVTMHNTMAEVIAETLARVGGTYAAVLAWTSPGLTHRSFLADAAWRAEDGIPVSRPGRGGPRGLVGVLDLQPGAVTILPTRSQLADGRGALATRMRREGRRSGPASVRSVFARGDGHDTPLGLAEMVRHLVAALDERAEDA